MNPNNALGFLLTRASQIMIKTLNKRLENEGLDLPVSQFIVLYNLYMEEEMSQQALSKKIYKDKAAIARSIENLEKKGLIKRGQISLRENRVRLTDKGNAIMPIALQCMNSLVTDISDKIPENEYQIALKFLNHVYDVCK